MHANNGNVTQHMRMWLTIFVSTFNTGGKITYRTSDMLYIHIYTHAHMQTHTVKMFSLSLNLSYRKNSLPFQRHDALMLSHCHTIALYHRQYNSISKNFFSVCSALWLALTIRLSQFYVCRSFVCTCAEATTHQPSNRVNKSVGKKSASFSTRNCVKKSIFLSRFFNGISNQSVCQKFVLSKIIVKYSIN